MDYEPEAPFKKSRELGTLLNLSPEVIDAAQLKNELGEELIRKATSSKKRQKWITTPAGIVLIGCLAASAFGFASKDENKEYSVPFKTVFALAMGGFMAGRLSDREKQLRQQVTENVIAVAVKRGTQGPNHDL